MKVPDHFSLHYAPESWSSARKFLAFAGPPFKVDSELRTGTAAAVAHREKCEILGGIANELVPKVQQEASEFEEHGYSSGVQGRALAAIAEAMCVELYSCLDGLRRAVFSAYRGTRSVQNQSTLKLFALAAEAKYGEQFDPELNDRLTAAYQTWFPRLRKIRTEVTHGETGRCWANLKEEGRVQYSHGYSSRGRPELHIEDIVGYGNETYVHVIDLVEFCFDKFFKRLIPLETRYVCGVYHGRIYERMVAPTPSLSFNDGRCWSRPWFDKHPEFECPMRGRCGAYTRPVTEEERDAYYKRRASTA